MNDWLHDFELVRVKGGYQIKRYKNTSATTVIVPSTINGVPVVEIGINAFNCQLNKLNLKKIKIEEGVKSIKEGAFRDSANLLIVDLPNSVEKIDSFAFAMCTSLRAVHLPDNLEEIPQCMFASCHKLEQIRLPSHLKKIGWSAFYACKSLRTITIPKGTTSISSNVFGGCTLDSIYIPKTVSSFASQEFDRKDLSIFYDDESGCYDTIHNPKFVLYCEHESEIERLAQKYQITFAYWNSDDVNSESSAGIRQEAACPDLGNMKESDCSANGTSDELAKLICSQFDRVIKPSVPLNDGEACYVFFDYDADIVSAILYKRLGKNVQIDKLNNCSNYIKVNSKTPYYEDLSPQYDENLRKNHTVCISRILKENNIPTLQIHQYPCREGFSFRYSEEFSFESDVPGFRYRPDLGFSPRSSWEANFARFLNYKGISFEYEELAFLRKPKGMYIPDFLLPNNIIIEIKGFWSQDSRAKVKEFMANYPQYSFFIVDQDMYSTLNNLYSDVIPHWENTENVSNCVTKADVIGLGYGKRPQVIKTLTAGQPVILCRESANEYDRNAILVKTPDCREIGYLASDWACIYAPKIDLGMTFSCVIDSISEKKIQISVQRSNPCEVVLWDFLK